MLDCSPEPETPISECTPTYGQIYKIYTKYSQKYFMNKSTQLFNQNEIIKID